MTLRTSSLPSAAAQYASNLWRRREFAWFLALGNLKARNASTSLGLFWWVLDPILLGSIYALVFGVIFQVDRDTEAYVAYLMAGMFAFHYTRQALTGSVNSIVSNTRLLANLNFPRLVLPISSLMESAFGFAASLVVYYVIIFPIDGVRPTAAIVWLIPAFIIHTFFNLGLGSIAARVAVPFRDVNNLVPYLLRLWLYMSPVIYPVTRLEAAPENLVRILEFNPMFPILAMYRHALMGDLQPLTASDVWMSTAWAAALALGGVATFIAAEGRMSRYV